MPDGRRPPLGMITLACWPVDGPPSCCCCCCCPGCFIEGLALLLCCCCCCWLAWWKSLVSWVWKAPVDSEISGLSWNGAKFTHNLHRPFLVPSTLTRNCSLFPEMLQLYCNFSFFDQNLPFLLKVVSKSAVAPSCIHCQDGYSSFWHFFFISENENSSEYKISNSNHHIHILCPDLL